ncbi:pescadillo amine-terminal protein (macronuclear) [Tetrahymena thermophila SB210]|uniref:Pescadillo homolog n=1 Tax=Tetrahymena thermophila (strain SB210) TaxID=312017 RepID=Q23RV6_TETTS|nr:pescadillo amine-terminal protein [Tetrahymena thermophila SB210]EAR99283.1 pescadillo amine-terminal protein [Tetrahymena thermophila SB210]|eukprot:XP_001019528.1 pescadillo amine-terminal protein [Tetrahymena thermophila SB210]
MVKKVMKNTRGEATKYISRAKAIKKLQVSLKDFRRLCILKGVYPREPPKKLQKQNKTYYHLKDINYLMHEKILNKFRELKTHMKKVMKLKAKGDKTRLRLLQKQKPTYSLNHLVKERYPTFIDALRDLDDPLCLVNLFASFPAHKALGVPRDSITKCIKLMREFNLFVIKSKSLRKVFISIKGIYYQAEIEGQKITWIAPFQLPAELPAEVDYKVMLTFLEFYETLIKFVNFKLFNSINVKYPLEINKSIEDQSYFSYSSFVLKHKDSQQTIENAEEENEKYAIDDKFKKDQQIQKMTNDNSTSSLFKNCVFYLSSEVPRLSIEFIVLAFSGKVHWAGDDSEVQWNDPSITHFVTDRDPKTLQIIKNREYIQPQWIYDSINSGILLPVGEYAPGKSLPPHLSPFVEYNETEYKPERQKQLDLLKGVEAELNEEDEEDVEISEDEDEEEEQVEEENEDEDEEEIEAEENVEEDEEEDIDEEEEDDDEEEEEVDGEEELEEDDDDEEDEEEEINYDEESDVEDIKKQDVEESENEYDHEKEQQKKAKKQIKETKEQKELAKALMTRKNKKMYELIQKSKQDKLQKVKELQKKAAKLKNKAKKN